MTSPLSVNAENTTKIENSCNECAPEECQSRCCICFCGRKVKHKKKQKDNDKRIHKVWFSKVSREKKK